MGGRNPFLGIAYVVVGGVCILLGTVFTVTHLVHPRFVQILIITISLVTDQLSGNSVITPTSRGTTLPAPSPVPAQPLPRVANSVPARLRRPATILLLYSERSLLLAQRSMSHLATPAPLSPCRVFPLLTMCE